MKKIHPAVKEENGIITVDITQLELFDVPELEYEDIKPFRELKPWAENLIVVIDIETTGLSPQNNSVKMVGFKTSTHETTIIKGHDERTVLKESMRFLRNLRPYAIVFHNGFAFDLPFLEYRCTEVHKIAFPFTKLDNIRTVNSASFHGRPIQYYPYQTIGFNSNIVDTMIQLCIWDKQAAKLDSYSLKSSVIALGLRSERRTELTYQEMLECYRTNNWALLEEYLRYDLDDTLLLANRVLPSYYYQQKWVPKLKFEYVCVASPALKAQMIHNEVCDNTPQSSNKCSYEGGISDVPNPGIYRNIFKLDITSLYPSIMLKYGVCSRKDTEKQFLRVLNKLRSERLKLKKSKSEEDQYEQEALKILINGSYGFLGTMGYSFNDYQAAALVTAYGRAILTLMTEILESLDCLIIGRDTDGIIAAAKENSSTRGLSAKYIHTELQNNLPDGILVELEYSGAVGFIPKAKNYIIINGDKQYIKGTYRKRNKIKLLNWFSVELIRHYATDGEQSCIKFYKKIIKDIIDKNISPEMLSITRKIAISEKTLINQGIGKAGETVTFYYKMVSKIGKRGTPLKPVKEATLKYEDHDPSYYINEINKLYLEVFPDAKIKTNSPQLNLMP